ncbi:MAG: hypothetical protein HY026_01065 [Deltaproteobacteria bacterium]|nr:hypothetical protein [Deltaproteobacteria bacterium]
MNESNKYYLDELKEEQKIIYRLLENTKDSVQRGNVHDIASHIGLLKNGFTAHIKKADKIYGDLLKTVEEKSIKMVAITIDAFSAAMKGIGERVVKFFDKYPDKDEIARLTMEFNRDFENVCEDIMKRVNNEEKVLYPMYEKHCC